MVAAVTESDVYDGLIEAQSKLANTQSRIQHIEKLQAERSDLHLLEQEYLSEIETKRRIVHSRCYVDKVATDDILSNVFKHLVHDFDPTYPWLLELVCKRWRNTCLRNPQLWSYLSLSSHSSCDEREEYNHAAVIRTMLQLERSKSAPLFIEIGTVCQCASQISRIQAVAKHCSRWRTLDITARAPYPIDPQRASEILRGLIPPTSKFLDLRGITWTCTPIYSYGLYLPFTGTTGSTLSRLTRVQLCGNLDFGIAEVHLPWSQLTSVDLSFAPIRPFIPELRQALSRCQRLTSLTLEIRYCQLQDVVDGAPEDAMEIIALPNVITFKIMAFDEDLVSRIIGHIKLPSLRCLIVGFIDIARWQAVLDLLQRSSCGESLVQLHLAVRMVDGPLLLRVLLQCPNLVNLQFHSVPSDAFATETVNEFLRTLAYHEGPEVLLPSLRNAAFYDVKFDTMLMIQMVDSRLRNGHSRSLTIGYKSVEGSEADREYEFCREILERKYGTTNLELNIFPLYRG